jgi:transcriptional regulator with XRE-family HTH domain
MTAKQQVGANVRRARKAAGLSQEALSFLAEIHLTQIGLYENGRRLPRLLTLVCLAGALGVTPNDLLAGLEFSPAEHTFGHFVIGGEQA